MSDIEALPETVAEATAFEAAVLARATRHYTHADDGKLAWYQWGDADASLPPLVLVPGGFGSWRHFALNVDELGKHYPTYVVELAGLGDSDPMTREHSAENIASLVAEGIVELFGAAAGIHLAGFSFGGIMSGIIAANSPELVGSLSIVGSNGLGLTIARVEMSQPRRDMDETTLSDVHRANLGALMIADPARVDALALHLQLETTRRARLRSGTIPHSAVLAQALGRVRCPVHGIWGSEDALALGFLQERIDLFETLKNSDFTIIDGAGHWVMYEQPEAFNKALLTGLSAL